MEAGAVAAMRDVKDGIRAAKLVMLHTKHTLLVGQRASEFALSMGLPGPTNLSSPESRAKWNAWKDNRCQPNFRKNVVPVDDCGPYHATQNSGDNNATCPTHNIIEAIGKTSSHIGLYNHDTIAMAVIDKVLLLQLVAKSLVWTVISLSGVVYSIYLSS